MKFKENKGITLIILIVTIIVLLIISGITISAITGGEGTMNKANQAKNETEIQKEMEELQELITKSAAKGIRHGNYSGSADAQTIREALKKNNLIQENPDDVIIDGKSEWIITGSKTGTFYSIHSDGNIERLKGIITEFKPTEEENVSVISNAKNIQLVDINNKPFIVPAGFGIAKDSGLTIEEGIIIEDAFSTDAKKGSQFVWVPVNTEVTYNSNYVNSAQQSSLANADSSIETLGATSGIIKLSRYDFNYREDSNSSSTLIPKSMQDELKRGKSNNYYTDSKIAFTSSNNITYKASGARDLEEFISKTNNAKGFYIGRYEVGKQNNISVCKKNQTTYTDIVRGKETINNGIISTTGAIKESRDMYGYQTGKYTSDLTNSFAWDTTITYIEKCGTNNNYAYQIRLQTTKTTSGNATDGTNKDVQCNIYDMAGNVYEWSTEHSSNKDYPYVYRGGAFGYETSFSGSSGYFYENRGNANIGFRPILYIL